MEKYDHKFIYNEDGVWIGQSAIDAVHLIRATLLGALTAHIGFAMRADKDSPLGMAGAAMIKTCREYLEEVKGVMTCADPEQLKMFAASLEHLCAMFDEAEAEGERWTKTRADIKTEVEAKMALEREQRAQEREAEKAR